MSSISWNKRSSTSISNHLTMREPPHGLTQYLPRSPTISASYQVVTIESQMKSISESTSSPLKGLDSIFLAIAHSSNSKNAALLALVSLSQSIYQMSLPLTYQHILLSSMRSPRKLTNQSLARLAPTEAPTSLHHRRRRHLMGPLRLLY